MGENVTLWEIGPRGELCVIGRYGLCRFIHEGLGIILGPLVFVSGELHVGRSETGVLLTRMLDNSLEV